MTTPSHPEPNPARNQPCYCGSGKKYKRCCGSPENHPHTAVPPVVPMRSSGARRSFGLVAILIFIAISVFALIAVYQRGTEPEATVELPTNPPEPWQYDAIRDQHWDPDHQHWHQGRPPQPAE